MYKLLEFAKSYWIAITLMTLSAVTVLSLWPLSQLPPVPGSDKTHHVIAYALLMLPTALRKPERWIFIGLFFLVYSGAIELLQPYVNRHGDWLDLLANTAGVVVGVSIAALVNRLFSNAGLKH